MVMNSTFTESQNEKFLPRFQSLNNCFKKSGGIWEEIIKKGNVCKEKTDVYIQTLQAKSMNSNHHHPNLIPTPTSPHLTSPHLPTISHVHSLIPLQKISSPILQHIPTHNKQRKNLSNARQIRQAPHIRHHLRRIMYINCIIHNPAHQISRRQPVQCLSRETCEIACEHGCGEETEVLEPVGLCAFAADDPCFGLS